jgi:hypothetical protein
MDRDGRAVPEVESDVEGQALAHMSEEALQGVEALGRATSMFCLFGHADFEVEVLFLSMDSIDAPGQTPAVSTGLNAGCKAVLCASVR